MRTTICQGRLRVQKDTCLKFLSYGFIILEKSAFLLIERFDSGVSAACAQCARTGLRRALRARRKILRALRASENSGIFR